MVFQLHVWGPAFGLPSIEPECIATIAYCQRVIPQGQWGLVSALHATVGVAESLPILFEDGVATADGFEDIVAYLRNHPAVADLDANLSSRQQTDKTAFIAFLQSVATPLIDLSLYVSAENYNQATSSAYTAILPWYANYTVPPKRRDLARARTAHMGLSSLDIDATADEGFAPGRGTASSEYEAAKRAAGIPTGGPPSALRMGRGKGIGGFLGAPVYAARFKLDALSNELLEPFADLLGKKQYLLHEGRPSSLDCLAFGYLSMLYYPAVPQPWLKETIQTKFPRVASYIGALRKEFFSKEDICAPDVWSISTGNMHEKSSQILPWEPNPQALSNKASIAAREMFWNIPLISSLARRTTVIDSNSSQVSVTDQSSLPMRSSRAPTASQIQNPPPPSSSTKSGRFFGKANIGHTFRHKSAGAFGPDLAKKLSQLVKMEKNVMRSMELVSRERMEVAQQLSIWGEACDDDVSDVTDKLGVLIYEIGELEDQYVDRYDQYRVTIKSIRNIEASVQPSRDRKQKITDQIAQLKYKEPNSPKIVVLEQELVRAEAESLVAEAQLSNITREKLKAAFTYQFDAMREHCEKLAIIAGYGKHLLELIDDNPVTPGETRQAYDGYEASKAIIQDCEDALTNWVSQNASVSSKLSQRSRTLSQRRRNATRRGDGVDLSGQDQPLDNRESGLWIPASEHQGNGGYEDRDDLDDDLNSTIASEQRGREEERPIAA
ncbi:Eisosome component PIL1-domain-containing protein [Paraphoma chrysanthemicola]|uniref:Eisosome component PIL1-domain-containing protein n=1 Tax=Paraphoma chrysanthemicola TaxID=798071 RepID=A0A8K0R0M2_9PLEO|nr:Eisosome component PIL1-domain-containing protein [Paraphoma chrysanthemicola]